MADNKDTENKPLDKAIDDAAKSGVDDKVDKKESEKKVASKDEDDDDNSSDNDGDDSDSGDSGDDAEITKEHKALIRLLTDPKTSKQTIIALAKQVGVDLAEGTKKETKKDLVTQLKDEMGDDFDLIPAKAWKAFELLIDEKLGEIRGTLEENERKLAQKEADSATNWLYRTYDDAKKFDDDILKLMGQYQFTPGSNQREYLEGLYLLAKARRTNKSSKEEITNELNRRTAKGKNDADSASGGAESGVKIGSGKRISIDEAISLAVQGKKVED